LDPSSPVLQLRSRRKIISTDGILSSRVKSVHDTLYEIIPLCKKIGVTRISDITFLDKLYIPNYSAILPGTEDSIWVYSGKGVNKPEAKASALMEAIERYSSLPSPYQRSFIQGTYRELSKSYQVLHHDEVIEPTNIGEHREDIIMDFLVGFDLLSKEEVLVPAEIALYKYFPKVPANCVFSYSHTNGLASGNVFEESICHALCEIIERDATSIADLCASSIQYSILDELTKWIEKETGTHYISRIPKQFVDDSSIFPDVDISEIASEFNIIKNLVKRFTNAGITLLIKDITQKDIGIPTFVASSVEWITDDYGYFAKGFGTHPDSRIALIRAITEVSQTRAANIQGARDDLKKISYQKADEIHKRKWQFIPASSSRLNDSIVKFSEINSYVENDILQDINHILRGLKRAGLRRVIVVDLTNPNIGIPNVRAIVPGLETFEVTKTIMGKRAGEYFKKIYYS
jgi:thioglycine synthase